MKMFTRVILPASFLSLVFSLLITFFILKKVIPYEILLDMAIFVLAVSLFAIFASLFDFFRK